MSHYVQRVLLILEMLFNFSLVKKNSHMVNANFKFGQNIPKTLREKVIVSKGLKLRMQTESASNAM